MATVEKWKSESVKISTIDHRMSRKILKTNHPLQRLSDQYNRYTKDSLISSVLNNDPIPAIIIAEQIINGVDIQWLLDGKQRCTTIVSYRRNAYRIGRNIERPIVKYRTTSKDKDGNEVDCYAEFDIRGKKYENLPVELQERFDEFPIQVTLFLDCSDEDIEYHIRRYNMGKPMTAAQKGITYLGEEFARATKEIADKRFFKNSYGVYSDADRRNGNIERIITEAIMGINYLNDWNPNQQKLCAFLKENVTATAFNDLEEEVNRICDAFDNTETRNCAWFNKKNSFLFFMLFDRFTKLHLGEDEKFVEFLEALTDSLQYVEKDGVTYEQLEAETKSKDKTAVLRKIQHLESLMYDYFGIEEKPVQQVEITNPDLKQKIEVIKNHAFISKIGMNSSQVDMAVASFFNIRSGNYNKDLQAFVDQLEITDDDINTFCINMDVLGTLVKNLNLNSKLYRAEYLPVVLSFISYCDENDMFDNEMEEWYKHFAYNFDKEDIFSINPMKNFELMIAQFKEYRDVKNRKYIQQ